MTTKDRLFTRIRIMISIFVILLILSGATAFVTYSGLRWFNDRHYFAAGSLIGSWLSTVFAALSYINDHYPLLFYGYDWLAFAHIVIGIAFIGPYRDPVRNKWIIDWGIISCLAVIPLAVIAGPVRGIPWYHILIDCTFGVIGIIPLLVVRNWIRQLEKMS